MENNIKNQILRRNSEFNNIKKAGKRFSPSKWIVINYKSNNLGCIRYGFTISKKVGNAVLRNKLKRWGREYFRNEVPSEFDWELDVNVIFRPIESTFYKELKFQDFKECLDFFFSRVRKNKP